MNQLLSATGLILGASILVGLGGWLYARHIIKRIEDNEQYDSTPQCQEEEAVYREIIRKDGTILKVKMKREQSNVASEIDTDMNELLDECRIKTKQRGIDIVKVD